MPPSDLALGLCQMRRVLRRALIWLRWPSSLFATLILAVALTSSHWPFAFHTTLWRARLHTICANGTTEATVFLWSESTPAGPEFAGWWIKPTASPFESRPDGWPDWEANRAEATAARLVRLLFPTWCMILPLAAAAWAGFRAKSRVPPALGTAASAGAPGPKAK